MIRVLVGVIFLLATITGAMAYKRDVRGVSTGMTSDEAKAVVIKAGGACQDKDEKMYDSLTKIFTTQTLLTCQFDKTAIMFISLTVHEPKRVEKIEYRFRDSDYPATLKTVKEAYDSPPNESSDEWTLPGTSSNIAHYSTANGITFAGTKLSIKNYANYTQLTITDEVLLDDDHKPAPPPSYPRPKF